MIRTLDAAMLGIAAPVEELIPLAKSRGFQAVSPGWELMEDPERLRKADALRREAGLSWGLLPMPADFYHWDLDDGAFQAGLEKLRAWGELAQEMEITTACNHVWPCSFREFDENFAWHSRRVEQVSVILTGYGVRYGLEFLGPHELRSLQPHEFVHSLAGVLAIADAAGGKAGVAFDTYHWYTSGASERHLLLMELKINRLVCLHLNDAPAGIAPGEQKDMVRRLPMETGVIDSRSIFRRFQRHGTAALYMIEPFEPARSRFAVMEARDAVTEAGTVMDSLERFA